MSTQDVSPASDGPKATRQTVPYPSGALDTRIGVDALEQIGRAAKVFCGKPRLAVLVSVGTADPSYAEETIRQLTDVGFLVKKVELTCEGSPASVACASQLYDALDALGVTGDDMIVALGDADLLALAAFVAGTWCGGAVELAIPTTLEAAVMAVTPQPLATSASGGMVSFDFWPRALFVDVRRLLKTAIAHDLARAHAVMVATAVADSESGLGRMVAEAEALAAGDEEALASEIYTTLRSRGKIITSTSVALRQALRYGLTFAEALASVTKQPVADLLGEGLRFESRVSAGLESLDIDTVLAQDDLLDLLGLPERSFTVDPRELLAAIKATSFKRRNRFQFALPLAPGRVRLTTVDDDMLREHVEAWCASRLPETE